MNPPQNLQNHFTPSSNNRDAPVSPMCCCYYGFTEESFFKFICIWDLVFGILSVIDGSIFSRVLSVLIFIFALISLIMYCQNKSYDTGFHKCYYILRIVWVFLYLISIIVIFVLFGLALASGNLTNEQRVYVIVTLVVYAVIITPLICISIQWSFLLKTVVQNAIENPSSGMPPQGQHQQHHQHHQHQQGNNQNFQPQNNMYSGSN